MSDKKEQSHKENKSSEKKKKEMLSQILLKIIQI